MLTEQILNEEKIVLRSLVESFSENIEEKQSSKFDLINRCSPIGKVQKQSHRPLTSRPRFTPFKKSRTTSASTTNYDRVGLSSASTSRSYMYTDSMSSPTRRKSYLSAAETFDDENLPQLKPCRKMDSLMNDDLEILISEFSRQCCDILGSEICHDCCKTHQQYRNSIYILTNHPDIDETTTVLYAVPLIQRSFPHLTSYEIKEKLKTDQIYQENLKMSAPKVIKNFDENVTDIYLEKHKRRRMRRDILRVQSADAINRLKQIEKFNPANRLPLTHRSNQRRNALFPTDYMASGMSTPSTPSLISRASTPESDNTEETKEDENEIVDNFKIECAPSITKMKWSLDFPSFHIINKEKYKLPLWKLEDLPKLP